MVCLGLEPGPGRQNWRRRAIAAPHAYLIFATHNFDNNQAKLSVINNDVRFEPWFSIILKNIHQAKSCRKTLVSTIPDTKRNTFYHSEPKDASPFLFGQISYQDHPTSVYKTILLKLTLLTKMSLKHLLVIVAILSLHIADSIRVYNGFVDTPRRQAKRIKYSSILGGKFIFVCGHPSKFQLVIAWVVVSVTKFGDLLDFGQLLNAFGIT